MGLGIAIAVGDAPDPELASAASVEVYQRSGRMTSYRIRYGLDVVKGDFPRLADARTDAGAPLAVIVPFNGKNVYLVKGPVTGQDVHFEHGVAGSYVDVIGADSSAAMDRQTKTAVWADVSDADAVTTIAGQYGFAPDVSATPATHAEDKHALVQRDTDYRFVRRLARRNGALFWVDADATGVETAHFRRPALDGAATDLAVNLAGNALESLDVRWDVERPASVVAAQLDLSDKSDVDGATAASPLAPLGKTPFAAIGNGVRSTALSAPVDDAGDLTARAEAVLIEAGWFVRATCRTTLRAAGAIVQANQLVNLRGAGARHSGKYFVAGVRHVIDAAAHRMEIEMVRNAWGA
jgi:phage protein D